MDGGCLVEFFDLLSLYFFVSRYYNTVSKYHITVSKYHNTVRKYLTVTKVSSDQGLVPPHSRLYMLYTRLFIAADPYPSLLGPLEYSYLCLSCGVKGRSYKPYPLILSYPFYYPINADRQKQISPILAEVSALMG